MAEQVTAADVVAAARELIGTPFHHQGRSPGVGIDCGGVLIVVGRRLGLLCSDFDVRGYARIPDGVTLRRICDEQLDREHEPRIGGVVLVRWKDGEPQHVGIVGDHVNGGLSLIHADSKRQKQVIETRLEFSRYMRLVAPYSFRGIS